MSIGICLFSYHNHCGQIVLDSFEFLYPTTAQFCPLKMKAIAAFGQAIVKFVNNNPRLLLSMLERKEHKLPVTETRISPEHHPSDQ